METVETPLDPPLFISLQVNHQVFTTSLVTGSGSVHSGLEVNSK